MLFVRRLLFAWFAVMSAVAVAADEPKKPLRILFLGDQGHHQPAERFRNLQHGLAGRGIDLQYTDNLDSLNPKTLSQFDGLAIYANHTAIKPEQEKALLDFVAGGKGFIPLHCASYCFLNSPKYVELVGAQFKSHGTGVFRVEKSEAKEPAFADFQSFESWDETYVHTKHNEKDRTVLEYRIGPDGREPWTWTRTHGQGRVFYTAWGHDERTWTHPGFLNLVERGIRWATKDPTPAPPYVDAPKMTSLQPGPEPFQYADAKVPFYPPSRTWGVTGEPRTKMQKPLSPEESLKRYVVPEGFELKLFAAEPDLPGKPIAMNWDERGRLWVCCTVDYPNDKQPDGQGHDQIVICEDTDGDGKADKFTVFADKLSIPTGLTFSRGGVIVLQPPHTLFLKDTDGDGKADERRILFTGWGTGDTHAGPSNLVYGFDNWIYGIVGYSAFDGDVGGKRVRFGQGLYRFKPDGSELEFLRSTTNNSWGVGFSEDGQLFASTANGCPSVHMAIPNRYYEAVRGWSVGPLQSIALSNAFHPITDKVRQVDYHGGFTAAAGHALYAARAYPKEYWNRTAFVCEPTGHLVATFVLQPNGSSYIARYGWNLVASDDEWASPVAAEVGPDGCVWISDWYSFIVQHNPTPAGYKTGKGNAYETDLRDKKHGRIYRLVHKDQKPAAKLDLTKATPQELVQTLRNDNLFWRRHAQRLLVERGNKDVAPALFNFVREAKCDAIGIDAGSIHALWTLQGLGGLDELDPVSGRFPAPDPKALSSGARRAAIQTLPPAFARGLQFDADPQVRLAALLRLAEDKSSATLAQSLASLPDDQVADRSLLEAMTIAAARHAAYFLSSEASLVPVRNIDQKRIDRARLVAEHFARCRPTAELERLMSAPWELQPKLAEAALQGLAKGWPADHAIQLSDEGQTAVVALFDKLPPTSRPTLIRLARVWGVKKLEGQIGAMVKQLEESVRDGKKAEGDRLAAAKELVELQPEKAAALFELVSPKLPPALASGLVEAAGKALNADQARAALALAASWTPAARQALFRVLGAKNETALALLDAIQQGKLAFTDLALDQRQSLAEHPSKEVAGLAKRLLAAGGGLPNPDRQKVIDDFLPRLKQPANATLGKAVFAKHCAICHKHGEEGAAVGPDLTGMNAHPKEELLIHLLDPNRSVEGNYRSWNVLTKDGKLHQGMLASETRTALELIDTQGKKHVLQRDEVDELAATNKSLMPEGFEKQLTPDELANLVEFLAQRGKYVPLPLAKVATITSVRGMFFGEEGRAERLVFPDWKAKSFNGVPFLLVDPEGGRKPNVVLLHGPQGQRPPQMPRSVTLPCAGPAKALHFLSGISGWGFPNGEKGSVSLIVRLAYEDGQTEDHELKNGEQFADYIRRVDVPGSQFAFNLNGRQVRYFKVEPKRSAAPLKAIELRKGPDDTAPIIVAVTAETP